MVNVLCGPLQPEFGYIDVDDPMSGFGITADGPYEVVYDSGASSVVTNFLLVVGFAVPDEAIAEFDDWYDAEHSPLLLSAPSWLRIRRLRSHRAPIEPGALNCLVLHDLADLAVLDGPERKAAQQAPKRAIVATRPWYATSRRRTFRPL